VANLHAMQNLFLDKSTPFDIGMSFDAGPTFTAFSVVERHGSTFKMVEGDHIELHGGFHEDQQFELPWNEVPAMGEGIVAPLIRDVGKRNGLVFIERIEGGVYDKKREKKLLETTRVEEHVANLAWKYGARPVFIRASLWMQAWTRYPHVSSGVAEIVAKYVFNGSIPKLSKAKLEHVNDSGLLCAYGLARRAGMRVPFDLPGNLVFLIEQLRAAEKAERKSKKARGEPTGIVLGPTVAEKRRRSAAARAGHRRRSF
jgi:hypothetical protein